MTFSRVATLTLAQGYHGGHPYRSAIANIDEVGGAEFLVRDHTTELSVYRAVAPGSWARVIECPDATGDHTIVRAFDINRNGRAEVFWATTGATVRPDQTMVLEYPIVPTDIADPGNFAPESLTFYPNPCRTEATMLLGRHARSAVSMMSVFDVAGRLVTRQPMDGGTKDRLVWSVVALQSGLYFLRLEDARGASVATGRFLVFR